MKKKEIKLYKWAVDSNARLEDVLHGSRAGLLKNKLDAGEKLSDTEWVWLTERINTPAFVSKGCVSVLGWCFDFRAWVKVYVVKRYGQWEEWYAPNKTILRKSMTGGSQVKHILEVK